MYSEHNSVSMDGEFELKTGITFVPDTEVCAGGGLGAILISCKETVGGETDNENAQKFDISSTTADASHELSNSFSITWSYTTSSNPHR